MMFLPFFTQISVGWYSCWVVEYSKNHYPKYPQMMFQKDTCGKPLKTAWLNLYHFGMIYTTHENGDDLGMVYDIGFTTWL